MIEDLDAFLNTELRKLPEFQPSGTVQRRKYPDAATVSPDASGCIYEVCGLCGVTLDCVSSFSDAEKLAVNASHEWSFYQIWQIYTGSGERILVSQKEIRRAGSNPLGAAAIFKNMKDTQKGQA